MEGGLFLSRAATRAAAVLVAALTGFSLLARGVVEGGGFSWDAEGPQAADALYEHETAWRVAEASLDASIGIGAVLAVAVFAFLLLRRRGREAVFWAAAVVGVLLLDLLLKAAFARPGIGAAADDYSFPSGNAMASVAVVAAGVVLLRDRSVRRAAVVLGMLAVLAEGVGLVLLGWHYPSDVLAGWCAAAAWVALLWLVLLRRGRTEPAEGGE
ncbi:MAG: phosphatase PAP2 family protein [Gaiellaceae bacterium]